MLGCWLLNLKTILRNAKILKQKWQDWEDLILEFLEHKCLVLLYIYIYIFYFIIIKFTPFYAGCICCFQFLVHYALVLQVQLCGSIISTFFSIRQYSKLNFVLVGCERCEQILSNLKSEPTNQNNSYSFQGSDFGYVFYLKSELFFK